MPCTIMIEAESLLVHMKAALATSMYETPDDSIDKDEHFIMLYQGKGDIGNLSLSVFSYDSQYVCACHSRLKLVRHGLLPLDDDAQDTRAYMSVSDLEKLVKWLRTLPRGSVEFRWNEVQDSVSFCAEFYPHSSKKNYDVLSFTYLSVSGFSSGFKALFKQGRCACINANRYQAVRQYGAITTRPLMLKWLDELYDGRSVDLVPFDTGNKLYIRSDFRANIEAVCALPFPARSNAMKRRSDD